jgi:hypothetical protein
MAKKRVCQHRGTPARWRDRCGEAAVEALFASPRELEPAIDAKNRKLFGVRQSLMAVSDPTPAKCCDACGGAGSDGCAFDPSTGYAFSSNRDGT